jgi:hypothetical protein
MPYKWTVVLAMLALAACSDARGLNAFEAPCVDRENLRKGTAEFDACVRREHSAFEAEMRARNRIGGTL